MLHNSKQLQQLQADLAAAHAEIHKLQQENAFLRKQLVPTPSTTDTSPSPSGGTASPTVPPPPSLRSPSPDNASPSPPPPKTAKLEHDNSQPSLAAIARQFSSPAESTGFKLIHGPVRCRLPLQQLLSNLRILHINTRRILDIHYLPAAVGVACCCGALQGLPNKAKIHRK